MELIDTHTHLYLPEFDTDRDETIGKAVSDGVVRMLMPNIDADSLKPMLAIHERYRGICYPMLGLHPTSVKEDYLLQLARLQEIFDNRYIAIGEIGIDLYWDRTFIRQQMDAFRRQVTFALEKKLPVVVHSRDSFPEVFEVIGEFGGTGLKGVLHAFTGTPEYAEKAIEAGFMLGIGGIVTFKNSGLDTTVKIAGIKNIVLETDSPYLAPVPHRGKRNESSYICIINRKIADIFAVSEEEAAEITYRNSSSLFGLD